MKKPCIPIPIFQPLTFDRCLHICASLSRNVFISFSNFFINITNPPLHASRSSISPIPHCMLASRPGLVFSSFVLVPFSHFRNRSYSIWSGVSHTCQFFLSLFHLSDQLLSAAISLQLLPHTPVHSSTSA